MTASTAVLSLDEEKETDPSAIAASPKTSTTTEAKYEQPTPSSSTPMFTSEWFDWAFNGDIEKLKLIQQSRNMTDVLGQTPLFYACTGGHLSAVHLLCDLHQKHGESLNRRDYNSKTAFTCAVSCDHIEIVQTLIETYNISITDNKTSPPAAHAKSIAMMKYLIEKKADTTNVLPMLYENTFAKDANSDMEMFEYFLSQLSPTPATQRNIDEIFYRHINAQPVSWALLNTLIQYGANIHSRWFLTISENDLYETSSLHQVVKSNATNAVQFLLERKADPNVFDGLERQPLSYATSIATAELLVKHGANVNAQGKQSELTALHFVETDEMVVFLKQHGANFNLPANNAPFVYRSLRRQWLSITLLKTLIGSTIVDDTIIHIALKGDAIDQYSYQSHILLLQSLTTGHFDIIPKPLRNQFLEKMVKNGYLTQELVRGVTAQIERNDKKADYYFDQAQTNPGNKRMNTLVFLAKIYRIKAERKGFLKDAHINALAVKETKPTEPDYPSMGRYLTMSIELSKHLQPPERNSFCLNIAIKINKLLDEDPLSDLTQLPEAERFKQLQLAKPRHAEKIKHLQPLLQQILEHVPFDAKLSAEEHLEYANLLTIYKLTEDGKPMNTGIQFSIAVRHAKEAIAATNEKRIKDDAVELKEWLERSICKTADFECELAKAPAAQSDKGDAKSCDQAVTAVSTLGKKN